MQFDNLDPNLLRDAKGYSVKWHYFPADVLPMWVADMDYPVAQEIIEAIKARLEYRLGYPQMGGDKGLLEAILAQQGRFGLTGLAPENLWLTTSVVPAIYAALLGLTSMGDEVITQVPVYHPFLNAIRDYNRVAAHNPMVQQNANWAIDFDQLESLVTPATRLLMLCNPQNPTGRVFTRSELERLGEFALKHRLWVMVDELWSELIYEGEHIPLASLSDEIAQRTVTLTGPCKAFNTAGLGGGVAISHNKAILERMKRATAGVMGHPNVLAMTMWQAGLEQGQGWLEEVRGYLKGNRDLITAFVREQMPQVGYIPAQGTYLAWFDLSRFPFSAEAQKIMLEQARVGLNDGAIFGPQFQGWLRLNFATSRGILQEGLERIAGVVQQVD